MKIGFIVENDSEKRAVESVARRLLPRGVHFHTVRVGGKAGLSGAYGSVYVFLDKGYDHVFIIVDADSTEERVIAEYQAKVEALLRQHRLEDRATAIIAVPNSEAWVAEGAAETNPSLRQFESVLSRVTSAVAQK